MKISNVRWLYYRLRAMSAGEVLHRVREHGKRSFDSKRTFHFDDSAIALPVIPGLRDRVTACSASARERFRAFANATRAGHYDFLGLKWPQMGEMPDWHLDPVSGRRWPDQTFCYSVPYRHNDEYGDVKFVWELNRLQHLQIVAAGAACENDPELAALCVRQIRSWIDANPPFKGLNWSSGIELALRVVSLVVVFSLIPPSSITYDDRRAISASLRAHLYWLKRYPSRYSSANNHLIAEAGGLFLMSLLLPELSKAKGIERYARNVLNTEALLQFYPDGVPAEQSPTYGAFSAEWLLCAHAVASTVGHQGLADSALRRLSEFGTFLSWITDKCGNFPRIGDDDEGRVILGIEDNNGYVASIRSAAASFQSYPHALGGNFDSLRNAVLSLTSTSAQTQPTDIDGVRTFPTGGYTIVRETVGGRECMLVFDHGPLGYLGIAAHGHADALAIWAHYEGKPVLVDAGTYLYHSGGKWRSYFRGTRAHSTLSLGHIDQSIPAGDFNWSSKADARIVSRKMRPNHFSIEAEHDGYLKQFGVLHRRTLEHKSSGTFVIKDALISTRATELPEVEVGFIVSGDLDVRQTATGWAIFDKEGPLMSIDCPFAREKTAHRETGEPAISGWMSLTFGSRRPAWRLVALCSPGNDARMTTISFLTRLTELEENEDRYCS